MGDFFVFVFVLIVAAVTCSVLGVMAFLRTNRLREALLHSEQRIALLEQVVHELTLLITDRDGAPREKPEETPAAAPTAPAYAPWRQPAATAPIPPAPREPAPSPAPVHRTPQPTPQPAGPTLMARLEKGLASNWLVWAGGLLIALAIVVLLRLAIQEGYFGPPQQLMLAYILGGALIGAAEWVRRNPPMAALSHTLLAHLPAILAGAGLFAFFAATYAGHVTFEIVPVSIAFVLMALSSLAAIVGALRFGKWLAALGLAGGYLAPALVHFADPSPPALFGYLLALTITALTIIRLRAWRGFVWLAAAGALVWGYVWVSVAFTPEAQGAAAFYLVALAGVGVLFAWNDARAPLVFESWWRIRAGWTESAFAAHVIGIAAALVLLLLAESGGHDLRVIVAIVALSFLTCIAAYLRQGFALAPLGAGVLATAALASWPEALNHEPVNSMALFRAAGTFGFLFSAAGWLLMIKKDMVVRGPGATLAALVPIAIVFVTHEKAEMLRSPLMWSALALLFAGLNTFALERIARALGGLDAQPGPSAAFSLGAAAAAILTILFAFPEQPLLQPTLLALLIPIMAWLDLRFRLPALRVAIGVAGLIVAWSLGPALPFTRPDFGSAPVFNALIPSFAIATASFWAAASLYRSGGVPDDARIMQGLEAGALALGALGLSLEIRLLASGGALYARGFSLAEVGAYATAWAGLALSLAARFGPKPRHVIFIGEAIAIGAAAWMAGFFALLIFNPWTGADPQPAPGAPIFNLLLAVYGVPAVLFAAYAVLRRRQGLARRGQAAGAFAVLLAFTNVTLEVRRLFHPDQMSGPPIGPWETWAYSGAWTGFALVLLGLGLVRERPSLRYASLMVLILALAKVFLFDLGAASGLWKVALLLGLGVSVLIVALIYQRFVFPKTLPRVSDANMVPPPSS